MKFLNYLDSKQIDKPENKIFILLVFYKFSDSNHNSSKYGKS